MTTGDVKEARVLEWKVGDRVAVNSRTCEDAEFAGLKGTVTDVIDYGADESVGNVMVALDADKDGEYEFTPQELCKATGFMPGATDEAILQALLGKRVTYYRDLAETEETVEVLSSNRFHRHKPNEFYRVQRFDNPIFDQVHFVAQRRGERGHRELFFASIYLSAIVEVRKGRNL